MRTFQAIFLTLVVTVYALVALAVLWRLARDAFSFIYRAVESRVQVKFRHWRIKPDWRSGDRRNSVRQAPRISSATVPDNSRMPSSLYPHMLSKTVTPGKTIFRSRSNSSTSASSSCRRAPARTRSRTWPTTTSLSVCLKERGPR